MKKITQLNTLTALNDNVIVPVVDLSEANVANQNKKVAANLLKGPQGDPGLQGLPGADGIDGKSAYEIAVDNGFVGTEAQWLESLQGEQGIQGIQGLPGADGVDGKSAYEVAVEQGFVGTEAEWLDSLVGAAGADGTDGIDGKSAFEVWQAVPGNELKTEQEFLDSLIGPEGKSAYSSWKELEGNELKTEQDFFDYLKGVQGDSAFQVWQAIPGNEEKTEAEFFASIKGEQGLSAFEVYQAIPGNESKTMQDYLDSIKGPTGNDGTDGVDGFGFKILAGLDNTSQLPLPENSLDQDAFLIDGDVWVFQEIDQIYQNMGSIRGEPGMSAFELAVTNDGFVGTYEEWKLTLKGKDGIGLRVLGALTDVIYLPEIGNESGDCYIVDYMMWVWVGDKWEPVGQVGAEGKSAYQLAKDAGLIASNVTLVQWLESLNGDDGKTAFEVWQAIPGNEAKTVQDFILAIKGEQGIRG